MFVDGLFQPIVPLSVLSVRFSWLCEFSTSLESIRIQLCFSLQSCLSDSFIVSTFDVSICLRKLFNQNFLHSVDYYGKKIAKTKRARQNKLSADDNQPEKKWWEVSCWLSVMFKTSSLKMLCKSLTKCEDFKLNGILWI